jgi:hypothetical protein
LIERKREREDVATRDEMTSNPARASLPSMESRTLQGRDNADTYKGGAKSFWQTFVGDDTHRNRLRVVKGSYDKKYFPKIKDI